MLRSNVGFPVMRVSETLLAGQRGFLLGDHRWTAHKLGQPWFRAGQAFAYGDAIPAFVSTPSPPSRFLSREVTGMSQTRLVKVCSWGTICGPVIKTDTRLREENV